MAIKKKSPPETAAATIDNMNVRKEDIRPPRRNMFAHLSESRYESILKDMQDGYFECDLAGNYTAVNESLCGLLGYSREELPGMNYRQHTDEGNARIAFESFSGLYR